MKYRKQRKCPQCNGWMRAVYYQTSHGFKPMDFKYCPECDFLMEIEDEENQSLQGKVITE